MIAELRTRRISPRPTASDSQDGQKTQSGPQDGAAPRGPAPAQPCQVAAGLLSEL